MGGQVQSMDSPASQENNSTTSRAKWETRGIPTEGWTEEEGRAYRIS